MKLPEYKELQDKGNYFDNYAIKTLKDFDTFYSDFAQKEGLIYRGVNEAKFHIYTSAQRFWLTDNLKSQSTFTCFIDVLLNKIGCVWPGRRYEAPTVGTLGMCIV